MGTHKTVFFNHKEEGLMKANKIEGRYYFIITLSIALFVTNLLLPHVSYAGSKSRKNNTKPKYKTEVTEWEKPAEQTYPFGSPPAGLRDNVAEAKWNVTTDPYRVLSYKVDKETGQIHVYRISTVRLRGGSTIIVPAGTDPNSKLYRHELGHDELCRFEYERHAQQKIRREIEKFFTLVKQGLFVVRSDDFADMKKVAGRHLNALLKQHINRALKSINDQMETLAKLYDSKDITDHDKNAVDPDDAVEAIKKGKKKVEAKRKQANNNDIKPSNKRSTAVGTQTCRNEPNGIFFDPPSGVFNGPFGGRFGTSFPITPLGPDNWEDEKDEDTHKNMTDTPFEITDLLDANNTYMYGAIFDVKYLPSNKDGFISMIQGGLYIPDDDFNGINNVIGWPWLDDMARARDVNEYTCFWFYCDQELFDEQGNWLPATSEVTGQVIIGVGETYEQTNIDAFGRYIDSADFNTVWSTQGNADIVLETGLGHGDEQCMLFTFDNSIAPHFSFARADFAAPVDMTANEDRAIEVWFNTLSADPNCLNTLVIGLEDNQAHYFAQDIAGTDEIMYVTDSNDEWYGIDIDLSVYEQNQLLVSQIQAVVVGFESQAEPFYSGTILIDDIETITNQMMANNDADFNGDGSVDFEDFSALAQVWLEINIWP